MKKYPPDAVCSRPNCNERPYARDLCKRHYGVWLYNRDWMEEPARHRAVNVKKRCEHCSRRAMKRGLCEPHYARTYRRSPMSDSDFWKAVHEFGRRDHEERVEEIGLTVHGRMV